MEIRLIEMKNMEKYRIVDKNGLCYIVDDQDRYMLHVIDGGDPLGMNLLASYYCAVKHLSEDDDELTDGYLNLISVVDELNRNDGKTSLAFAYFFARENEPDRKAFEEQCEKYIEKYGIRGSAFDEYDSKSI